MPAFVQSFSLEWRIQKPMILFLFLFFFFFLKSKFKEKCFACQQKKRKEKCLEFQFPRQGNGFYYTYNCTSISKTGIHLIKKEKQACNSFYLVSFQLVQILPPNFFFFFFWRRIVSSYL